MLGETHSSLSYSMFNIINYYNKFVITYLYTELSEGLLIPRRNFFYLFSVRNLTVFFIPVQQRSVCFENVYFEFYLMEHFVVDINVLLNIIFITTMITYFILIPHSCAKISLKFHPEI